YWSITAKIAINDFTIDVTYEKTFENLAEAEKVKAACKTKQGKIENVNVTEVPINPPVPFDLGALQSEAYKLFHLTPARTLSTLQHLYIETLISYPRTSSQKLPPSIGYQEILKKLGKAPDYSKHTAELLAKSNLRPNEGKKDDPAHPAIYPTGNLPLKPLDAISKNIFDLVVKRFLAVFGDPAIQQNVAVVTSLNGYNFNFSAARTLKDGWYHLYQPYVKAKNDALPPLVEGMPVDVKRITLKEHFTQPPARYNPRTLLQKMEKEEIGTKATRASIIETLTDRKYLQGTDKLGVSDLGFEVTEVLEKYCPTVISSDMTRTLEAKMEAIQAGKETKYTVLADAMDRLKVVTADLKNKEFAVGALLTQALQRSKLDAATIGICPTCKGPLVIITSKTTGKRFVGCNNYFKGKCNTTYPLPQIGTVKPLAKPCSCGAPIISVYMRGREPWRLCINPKCPTKGAARP
ncbi:MAG: DNA topoisomerase, partial [Candidatus Bathyarchaeota archaeon]|nr:DNA topoisomerase [Candidatus Bathyarchaeota archaeon]